MASDNRRLDEEIEERPFFYAPISTEKAPSLREPELSAFLAIHARLLHAREQFSLWQEAWAILERLLAARYQLEEGDSIDREGTIHRVGEAP